MKACIYLLPLLFSVIQQNAISAESGVPFKTYFNVDKDEGLNRQLPVDIINRGTIIAGTNPNTPPTTFFMEDNKTLTGREIDLMTAIGQRLGVKTVWQDTGGFDNIIPGLKAGRYDVAISNIRATPKRFKQVDFISYFNTSRQAVISLKSSAISPFTDLISLCGKTVGAGVGTAQIDILNKTSKVCEAKKQQPITVAVFPDRPAGVVAVLSGRVPLFYGPWEGLAWQVSKLDKLTISGQINVDEPPMSIALAKDSPLEPAILAALNTLIKDGTYQKILDHWQVGYGALPEAKSNQAIF
ncbi:ABC transporter substrate-binding protein [Erwiniaceae bacterium BAC15a-03b]|uniref:ABC transporter substrate-binding protein n=1 Tax=Winslowiella arboricola TaxID=2978220 RepID=A0A9J6PV09_9GAMM|nr:ABC transporter substrate-binding protein [Winslowiella arboricola]MCU5775272.1 ABC transporter substrate-binding protein [Winslowiella arboricola]MCU5780331.1 ABC transporter substrate-binding protein [Winslowiella arboricola]